MRPVSQRPVVIFATAPLRGPGVDTLRELGELIEEPWIDATSMRLLNDEQLAARIAETGRHDRHLRGRPVRRASARAAGLVAIGSTRGDPTNVDIPGATAKGIPVLRAPGRNADAVAEMTIALLFAVNRHVLRADADVRAGEVFATAPSPTSGSGPGSSPAAPPGSSASARSAAPRDGGSKGLGMKVIAYDPFAGDATHEDLDDAARRADVVSMHAAVTPDTLGMIGAEQFAQMRDGAIYLNSARAALHDTDALVEALRSGHLGGAGLDHFEGEMLPAGHPLLGHAQRRAHAPHRRRDLRHRGEPHHDHRQRPSYGSEAAQRRSPQPLLRQGSALA